MSDESRDKQRRRGRGGSRLAKVLGALAMVAVVSAALPAFAGATTNVSTEIFGLECSGGPALNCTARIRSNPISTTEGRIGLDAFDDINSRNRPEAMRVDFSVVGAGTFSHGAFCTPEEGVLFRSQVQPTEQASCKVEFTPLRFGPQTVIASFSSENVGGIFYEPSIGFAQVQAQAVPTTTAITCGPNPVIAGTPATCTTEVSQASAIPTPPSGTVALKTSLQADFSDRGCSLVPTGEQSASCSVTFIPLVARERPPIEAAYRGVTDTFLPSHNPSEPLVVEGRKALTALHCDRATVAVNQQTSCTVTVTDAQPIDAFTPEGVVFFSSSGSGREGSACLLERRATGEAFCQFSYGPRTPGSDAVNTFFESGIYERSLGRFELQVPGSPGAGPLLSKISFAPKRFRVGPKAKRGKKAVGGGVLRLTSNEPATLSISIDSLARGRGHRKPKPKHLVTLSASIAAGANRVPVSGRTGKAQKPLRPGSYRMTVTARNVGGDVSTPVVVPFTILPGHSG